MILKTRTFPNEPFIIVNYGNPNDSYFVNYWRNS